MGKLTKGISLLLLVCLFAGSIFAGCGSQKSQTGNSDEQSITPAKTAEPKAAEQKAAESKPAEPKPGNTPEPLTLPIAKEPLTLSYFIEMDYAKIGATVKNYGDMTCYKEIEKNTGIKINFFHPPAGQGREQFNLMLASRDFPDMIYWGWLGVPGGPQKAIDDGTIARLNDLIDKYSPNLKKFLEKEPGIKKDIVTDNNDLYVYPLIRYKQSILAPYGFMLRQDWLEKLKLQVPSTIDEWYGVLKAFKEKDPNGNGEADEIPFVTYGITNWRGMRDFLAAWGAEYGFYQVDGKVKYGPLEPEYKEFVVTMRKWYQEGLIDPDFATNDTKQHDAKCTGGIAGSFYGGLGDTMGRYIAAVKDKDPNYKIVPAPAPVVKKGEKGHNFRADSIFGGAGAAISTTSKHQKEAAKWLDYRYSDEGHMIINFGLPGVSYNMVNGYPQLTDEITKNPQGLSVDVALGRHAQGASGEAQLLDARVREQRMWSIPLQKEASMLWNQGLMTRKLPPMTPTGAESEKISGIMNEVSTYSDEMFNKFVMGQEPIERFDKFIETLKSMKIEEAIKIQQAALDRYGKRK